MNMNSKNKVLIFLHIPKTGGLTLRNIIDRQYKKNGILLHSRTAPSNKRLKKRDFSRIKCVYGHNRFGVHEEIHVPSTYITMLRDPVSRVISTYYFILARKQNRMHHKIKNMSLEDFVSSNDPQLMIPVSNHQTRYLSGESIPDLQKAKENIENHFSVVGITEMFDESIFLMKKELGWKNIFYTKQNVSTNRPKRDQISKETLEMIKSKNDLDYELYNYAKQSLQDRLDGLNKQSMNQLKNYMNRNKEA
jgi:hypothetical protein